MPKVLLEDVQGPFIIDRNVKPIVESVFTGRTVTRYPGRLSISDAINGNRRKYPLSVWQKNLTEGSPLKKAMADRSAFGLLEHPKDGHVDLNSPICVITTEAHLEDKEVHGEIMVLNTAEGAKLNALIEGGYNPTVSSRGYGSLIQDNDSVDVVQDDYICEGWDPVFKPSFVTAQLFPQRESVTATATPTPTAPVPATPKISESASAPTTTNVPLREAQTPTQPEPKTPPNPKKTKMNTQSIRESLSAIRGQDLTKLAPAKLAECLTSTEALHQLVAEATSGDPTQSWTATKLHNDISETEAAIASAMAAPSKKVAALNETVVKVLKVTKMITETAKTYKKQLSESAKTGTRQKELIETLVKRGRGWMKLAETRKTKLTEAEVKVKGLDERYTISAGANDIFAAKYIKDVTALGRRVLQLEFKEELALEANKELNEKLAKVTHPKHLVAIREALSPETPVVPVPPVTPVSPTPEKVVESVTPIVSAPVPTTPVVVKPVSEPLYGAIEESLADPSQLDAATAMVRRLSTPRS